MKHHGAPEPHWSVPIAVDEIPETGKSVELVVDAATRDAIAKALGLTALPRLEATFDLTRHGAGGARVVGQVSATIDQTCVVTLEPVENEIEEGVDLVFMPLPDSESLEEEGPVSLQAEDPPEALRDGQLDLAAVALEFLILGIDPYPRKPGVQFDAPASINDPKAHPFAALGALKKRLAEKDH